MLSRRDVVNGLIATGVGTMGFGGYALAEPFRVGVTPYALTPPGWTAGLAVRLAVIADLHVCEPWSGLRRLREIVARTNALKPDAVLLLGDYVSGWKILHFSRPVRHEAWATVLADLKAPLGVHAVLGNHDWWEDTAAQRRGGGPVKSRTALEAAGIPVYENQAVRLEKNGLPFWIAGLGDQWAFPLGRSADGEDESGREPYRGVDDLGGLLSGIVDDAPVVLMAHEPDIFPQVPERVSLTVAGHTHGGQVRIAGYAPIVPSRYGQRYVYGHIVEDGRNLVVSAGLGCSTLPVRFGAPPEIVLIDLAAEHHFA